MMASRDKKVNPADDLKEMYDVKNVYHTNNSRNHFSRNFLFEWLRQFLDTEINGFADLNSGVIYCQLLDGIFPGCVKINSVCFKFLSQSDYLKNYKLLERTFAKLGIRQSMEWEKLKQGSFSEHLHFLNWFRKLYDANDKQINPFRAKSLRGRPEFKIGPNVKKNVPIDRAQSLDSRPNGTKPNSLNSSVSHLTFVIPWEDAYERVKNPANEAVKNESPKSSPVLKKSTSVDAVNKNITSAGGAKQRRVLTKKK